MLQQKMNKKVVQSGSKKLKQNFGDQFLSLTLKMQKARRRIMERDKQSKRLDQINESSGESEGGIDPMYK